MLKYIDSIVKTPRGQFHFIGGWAQIRRGTVRTLSDTYVTHNASSAGSDGSLVARNIVSTSALARSLSECQKTYLEEQPFRTHVI